MYGLLVGIILFLAVLIILIVLVQNPKGGGLSSNFSSSNQFMGVKRTADFIEKATWSLAAAMVILSIIATVIPHDRTAENRSRIQDEINNTAVDPEMLPSYPTTPLEQPADQPSGQPEQTQQPEE